MTYEEWELGVPCEIREDSLWKMKAYRLGLFVSDLAWSDSARLARNVRARGLADQLYRAAGNISSNFGEGYSRNTGKDRARFYEYALGSAREVRDWYFKCRHILGQRVADHRIETVTEIIRLAIKMVSFERRTNRTPTKLA